MLRMHGLVDRRGQRRQGTFRCKQTTSRLQADEMQMNSRAGCGSASLTPNCPHPVEDGGKPRLGIECNPPGSTEETRKKTAESRGF